MLMNIWVKDKSYGGIHQVGTDEHDSLVMMDGAVHYYNLLNGCGTLDEYEFVEVPDLEYYVSVTPEQLYLNKKLLHKKLLKITKRLNMKKKAVEVFRRQMMSDCKDGGCETVKQLNGLMYGLESIVWYNGHNDWLISLAEELERAEKNYCNPLDVDEWHTEKHCIWMLLVAMFGDWGTSIRGGWISETKKCAEFIRNLCKRASGEEIDDE